MIIGAGGIVILLGAVFVFDQKIVSGTAALLLILVSLSSLLLARLFHAATGLNRNATNLKTG